MIEYRVEAGLPETSDPGIVLWLTCISDAEVVADIEGWAPLRPGLEGTAAPVADDDGPAGPTLADEEPFCWDAELRPDSKLLEPASICVERSLRDALVVASPPGWLPLARDDGREELAVTCDCEEGPEPVKYAPESCDVEPSDDAAPAPLEDDPISDTTPDCTDAMLLPAVAVIRLWPLVASEDPDPVAAFEAREKLSGDPSDVNVPVLTSEGYGPVGMLDSDA